MAKDVKDNNRFVRLSNHGVRIFTALCFSSALSGCGGRMPTVDTQVIAPPDVNIADISELDNKAVARRHRTAAHHRRQIDVNGKPSLKAKLTQKAKPSVSIDLGVDKSGHEEWTVNHNAKGEVIYYPSKGRSSKNQKNEIFGPAAPANGFNEAHHATAPLKQKVPLVAPVKKAPVSSKEQNTVEAATQEAIVGPLNIQGPMEPKAENVTNKPAHVVAKVKSAAHSVPVVTEKITKVEPSKVEPSDSQLTPQLNDTAKFAWPAHGLVTKQFLDADKQDVKSINILVPIGTPVHAADSGVVIYAGNGLKQFGNIILIKHANNIVTVYGNNSKLEAVHGQSVKKGEVIALSGQSGELAEPAIHFEVRNNLKPVNPIDFLNISSK